jgi:hypothetical protein
MTETTEAQNSNGTLNAEGAPSAGESAQKLTLLQDLFLERLQQLLKRKTELRGYPQLDLPLARALDKAIYSTYLDCLEQGVGEDAKTILRSMEKQTAA